jgi:hypothetical protein
MKAIFPSAIPVRSDRCAAALAGVLLLGGCARQDEELQRQLVETRAALAAKTKALEQAESQRAAPPAPAPAEPSAASAEELAKARARIGELESQLAAAKQQAAPATPSAPAPAKLDLDSLREKLEADLTGKAKTLREILLKQAGVAHIDEIGIRGIEYPPEIIAPFRSAITFALSSSDGRQLRLVFPVTADLEGSWSLPGPDKVQQAYRQVKDAAPAEPAVASAPVDTPRPASTLPAPAPPSQPPGSAPPASGFRQLDSNTFQFDWGDGTKGGSKMRTDPQPAAAPSAPVAAAPEPTKRAAPAAPAAPVQPEPSVPKPVMPVQRDIIIKF